VGDPELIWANLACAGFALEKWPTAAKSLVLPNQAGRSRELMVYSERVNSDEQWLTKDTIACYTPATVNWQ